MARPDKLRIPYEEFDGGRFNCVGRINDGTQFMAFVSGAFPGTDRFPDPRGDWRSKKSWNAVIHRFDADGNHVGSEAKRGGFDIEGREVASAKAWQHLDTMLAEFGIHSAQLCDIYVKPFSVDLDGVIHELEYVHEIDEDDGEEYEHVMMWPNDIMFHPPWDSGEYST